MALNAVKAVQRGEDRYGALLRGASEARASGRLVLDPGRGG
jgi:hypothetical protein